MRFIKSGQSTLNRSSDTTIILRLVGWNERSAVPAIECQEVPTLPELRGACSSLQLFYNPAKFSPCIKGIRTYVFSSHSSQPCRHHE